MKHLGSLKSMHDYEPFGIELEPIGDDTTKLNYKFTGQERDYSTGLDYMHFRYYASSMGRFLKPDNIIPDLTNPQNWNAYTYVKGNPVNFNDPTGHESPDTVQQSVTENTSTGSIPLSNNAAPKPTDEQNPEMNKKLVDQPKKVGDEYKLSIPDIMKLDLVSAQNVAMFNREGTVGRESFQPGDGRTYCNMATTFVASVAGAPLGPLTDKSGAPLLANAIASNLSKSREYFKVGPILAQALGNTGMLVIGAQSNPGGHGHVATVRPEGISGDIIRGGSSGPLIANVGRAERMGLWRADEAFNQTRPVNYYIPATNR